MLFYFRPVAKKILFFYLLFLVSMAKADERFGKIGRYSVETNYQFGRIIPHNSKFKNSVTDFTHSFEFTFYKQTLGEKAWQRKLHYPELGGSFVIAHNGDREVYGNAYMLLAVAKFWIVRSRNIDFFIRIGTGLAFTPTHFNLIRNRDNNAIGSLINSADQFRLGVDLKPDEHLHVMFGISLTHYSNAAIQLPNLGINVPAFTMGVRYFPKVSSDLKYNRSKVPKPEKKNEVMVKVSLAISEMQTYGGPKYPTYIGTAAYARYTSIANKVLGGACIEFSQGDYDFVTLVKEKRKYGPTASAIKFSLFAGDEIILGRVGIFFMAGVYAFNPVKTFPAYAKIGANYYLPDFGKSKSTRFFIGTNLKTHLFVAQYFEMSSGVVF